MTETPKEIIAVLIFIGSALTGLAGWFIRHITSPTAHNIERPIGKDKAVTIEVCDAFRQENAETTKKINSELAYIRQRVDKVYDLVMDIKNGKK